MSKTTVDSKIEDELIDLLEENGVLSLDGEVRYKTRAAVREALEPLQNHTGSTMQEAITIVKRKILSLTRPAPTIDELSEYVQDIIDEDNNGDAVSSGESFEGEEDPRASSPLDRLFDDPDQR